MIRSFLRDFGEQALGRGIHLFLTDGEIGEIRSEHGVPWLDGECAVERFSGFPEANEPHLRDGQVDPRRALSRIQLCEAQRFEDGDDEEEHEDFVIVVRHGVQASQAKAGVEGEAGGGGGGGRGGRISTVQSDKPRNLHGETDGIGFGGERDGLDALAAVEASPSTAAARDSHLTILARALPLAGAVVHAGVEREFELDLNQPRGVTFAAATHLPDQLEREGAGGGSWSRSPALGAVISAVDEGGEFHRHGCLRGDVVVAAGPLATVSATDFERVVEAVLSDGVGVLRIVVARDALDEKDPYEDTDDYYDDDYGD